MFFAIVFLVLGLFLLLNALGIIVGNFWGFFWAVVFLAIGFRLLSKKGKCPMCGWHYWEEKMNMKSQGHCCGHDHDHDADGEDHH